MVPRGPRLASQRVMAGVADELRQGRPSWFTALGASMRPAVRVVQRVELRPVMPGEPLLGHVVLALVGRRYWLHRVTEERADEVHIAGDNGMVNGWTPRSSVFGILGDVGEFSAV